MIPRILCRHWYAVVCIVVTFALASSAMAVTVKLRSGKQIEETMVAEGKVLVGGKWLTQAEAQVQKLQRIILKISTREASKVTERDTAYSTTYSRRADTTMKCWGEIEVSLSGLDPKESYTLKVAATQYRHGSGYYVTSSGGSSSSSGGSSSSSGGSTTSSSPNTKSTVDQEDPVTGSVEYKHVFKTTEYERTAIRRFSSYSGGSKTDYGEKSDGFDISIFIDGTLVYEQKKGESAKYYHVGSR